jgi:recombinational DNA repair ATPase RecF
VATRLSRRGNQHSLSTARCSCASDARGRRRTQQHLLRSVTRLVKRNRRHSRTKVALSPLTTRADLAAQLERQRDHDIRRGLTQSGPHRDDLVLLLGDHDLRQVGSAGQQRTAAIVLRMLESATHREATGVIPALLLDDPFAELDRRRTSRILGLLEEQGVGQCVLCVPREDEIPTRFTRLERWTVQGGVFAKAAR